MSRTLVIRADCSPKIGTGHVMRMIALGQAWQSLGGRVRIIGHVDELTHRLADEGFEITNLSAMHPDPDDAQSLLSHTTNTDWIAIDGYHFDTAYQKTVRDAGRQTLVLDDLFDRHEYHADILLNQNPDGPDYPYDADGSTLLLGTRYALLRKDFARDEAQRAHRRQATNILVTLGGADPTNVTDKALSAIEDSGITDLHVKVVAGAANPHLPAIRKRMEHLPFRCDLLQAVEDMPSLMQWADMAVSAAGTTSWELCFFGVPFLAVQIADNQTGVIRELRRHGAAACLDSDASLRDITSEFERLVTDHAARKNMAQSGMQLVDGKGAYRVAKTMFNADLTVRPAQAEDCETLLEWRNAPETRANSFNTGIISLDTHRPWFEKKLTDESCLFFIAMDGEVPVGQIRFDRENNEAIISVSVAPDMMNRGIGTTMTRLACKAMIRHWPTTTAVALVKSDNQASARMFEKAGFTQDKSAKDNSLCYIWSK